MNTETFTYLLAHPQRLTNQQLNELQKVVDAYPYFQAARALQLKGLKNNDSFLYNEALKQTAIHTADRDILFQYITSSAFVQDKISEQILQHDAQVNAIEVEAEDVSEQTAVALDNQLKAELQKAEAILNPELFERKVRSVVEISKDADTEAATAPSEKNQIAEEPIQTDAPLPFKKEDTHSFAEWLKLTQATPIDRSVTETTEVAKKETSSTNKKFELIEKFIQDKPKMEVSENPKTSKDLAEPYTQTPNALMTETLAKVYLQQKNYKKAIKAYEILILKNPEKSGFFADQIRAIKKLNTKEEEQ